MLLNGRYNWEVFLSASKQLFRQLVYRRTGSSSVLINFRLPLLTFLVPFSSHFPLCAFVRWPVSRGFPDDGGWRTGISQEQILMNVFISNKSVLSFYKSLTVVLLLLSTLSCSLTFMSGVFLFGFQSGLNSWSVPVNNKVGPLAAVATFSSISQQNGTVKNNMHFCMMKE